MGRLFESGRRRRTDGPKPGHVPADPPSQRAARGLRTRRMAQTQGAQTFGGKESPLRTATAQFVPATWRVSFEVFPGERFVLLGPSGCGKSTLLKAIAGFMQPVEGAFRLAGQPITKPR